MSVIFGEVQRANIALQRFFRCLSSDFRRVAVSIYSISWNYPRIPFLPLVQCLLGVPWLRNEFPINMSAPSLKRQRMERSFAGCLSCKRRKVKCDGLTPCSACRRQNVCCVSSFGANFKNWEPETHQQKGPDQEGQLDSPEATSMTTVGSQILSFSGFL